MTNSKLTQYAFNLADAICWLFIITAIASLAFTFIPPEITIWSIPELSKSTNITLEFINTAFNGLGFYFILKRKIIGFVFVILTFIFTQLAAKVFFIEAAYILIFFLIIIVLPWVLSYKEVLNAKKT